MAKFIHTKVAQLKHYCMQISLSFKPLKVLKTLTFAIATFFFALGGVIIGGIGGAMKGQTTETGICREAGIGALSGLIVALELIDSFNTPQFLTKVGQFGNLFNGKAFKEWVTPAIVNAYQWQMNYGDISILSDIFHMDEARGMSRDLITRLPIIEFCHNPSIVAPVGTCCGICLQDMMEGERARMLGVCSHLFHRHCIDEWIARNATCPTCRGIVVSPYHNDSRLVQSIFE